MKPRAQLTLFEDQRMSWEDALHMTETSLKAYAIKYKHWAIAYSGGKDSSAVLSSVIHIIETGRVPRPHSLTVLYSDTRMELPPLQASAVTMLDEVRRRGFEAKMVWPTLDDRYFVYMLGRGVPPPSNTFRWCTPQLKVKPMLAALKDLRQRSGEKILMLTGVRIGESAARDQRIALGCGKNGSECGQGWFQETTPESIADTLAPILHWRVCFVWDWLFFFAPEHGFPTQLVAEAYGGEQANEIQARTGCIGCPLASLEVALDTILENPKWKFLTPLKELKPFYREVKKSFYRIRKDGSEKRKDGELVKNPCRMGPLTMDARRNGLEFVLSVQDRINRAANGMPEVDLINAEEKDRILELIADNTWPNGWDGTEPVASLPFNNTNRDGSVQPIMHALVA
jgi:DNA sulfur modification protein DndC